MLLVVSSICLLDRNDRGVGKFSEELNRKGVGAGHFSMLMMFWWQTQGQSCRLCWMWLKYMYEGGRWSLTVE